MQVGFLVTECVQLFCDPMDYSLPDLSVMWFFSWDYWKGLPSPFARDLPDPGIELSPSVLAGKFFITEPPGKHQNANT